MTTIKDILDNQYMAGHRDTTRRSSGKSANTHQALLDIEKLIIEEASPLKVVVPDKGSDLVVRMSRIEHNNTIDQYRNNLRNVLE